MIQSLGQKIIAALDFTGDIVLLFGQALSYPLRGRLGLRRTIEQMATAGADSLPIVNVTLVFVGMAWGWHTAGYMVRYGAVGYFGGTTAIAIARELAPALCGVVVAARIGSAYAAELGTMTVTEQIDALRALGISPTYYLVAPRVVACLVMLPILTVTAIASGLFGAFLLGVARGISYGEYLASVQTWLAPSDVYGGMLKTVAFGLIIALVGCRQGLRATRGAAGVGQATISAVVLSIILIYAANLILTTILFIN